LNGEVGPDWFSPRAGNSDGRGQLNPASENPVS
jgi:hypothetical protein